MLKKLLEMGRAVVAWIAHLYWPVLGPTLGAVVISLLGEWGGILSTPPSGWTLVQWIGAATGSLLVAGIVQVFYDRMQSSWRNRKRAYEHDDAIWILTRDWKTGEYRYAAGPYCSKHRSPYNVDTYLTDRERKWKCSSCRSSVTKKTWDAVTVQNDVTALSVGGGKPTLVRRFKANA